MAALRTTWATVHRAIFGTALAAAAVMLHGCGGLGLTGGSVPVGTILFRGTVIQGGAQTNIVANAPITLVYTPTRVPGPGTGGTGGSGGAGGTGGSGSTGGGSSSLVTGANGEFNYGPILQGSYRLLVVPPPSSSLGTGYAWAFNLPAGAGAAQMLARMWPAGFDPGTVGSVRLQPALTSVHVGQSISFQPEAFDQFDTLLPETPSILVIGNVGDVSLDGTLHTTTVGRAKVIAWIHGVSASADVLVSQ